MFESLYTTADVLCLASYYGYILAGIGSDLYIYDKEKLKSRMKVFIGERIHSIILQSDIVLIKGCKEVAFGSILISGSKVECQIFGKVKCEDWIQDVFYDKEKGFLVLATAHNMVEIWSLDSLICKKKFVCEEKCILYSCKFLGLNVDDFIVLAGTVFSEIVVWAPVFEPEVDQPVIQRLRGHAGVIFSITTDPIQRIICSTSDDRSVRVWRVHTEGSILERKSWEKGTVSLIHTLYGHTARVWQSLILPDCIISVGEDSKLCVWSMEGKLENSLEVHHESGVRGLTYDSETESVVTGGEDGGISVLSLNELRSRGLTEKVSYDLSDMGLGIPRKVAFLWKGLFSITDRGSVLFLEGKKWISIYQDKEFSNYCLMESSPCDRYLFLGSIKGRVVIMEAESKKRVFDGSLVDGKIFSAHWLIDHVVLSVADGIVIVYEVSLHPILKLEKKYMYVLPNSKERWTTCALIFEDYLICGDRMGNIHVFSMTSAKESPQQSFFKIHGHLGVTDIIKSNGTILSSGRDGTVKQFRILNDVFCYSMKYKLPMDWPWKIVIHRNRKFVLGFSSVNFVVYGLENRELCARYDCGGGHRSSDYRLSNDHLKFLCIRDKKIFLSHFSIFSSVQIRSGFHGKGINCLKIIHKDPLIVLSGSEDTTLRITRFSGDSTEELYTVENHISSVKDVCAISVSEMEKLLISCGGRAQISVHRFFAEDLAYQIGEKFFLYESDKKSAGPSLEGETRIMCVDSIKTENGILLGAACSDRRVRMFGYDKDIKYLTSISYSHCVMKVKFIQTHAYLAAVSLATDGCIVFWNIKLGDNLCYEKMYKIRVHQSGINSFEIKYMGDGKFFLATGGDDNLLSVILMECEKEFDIMDQWKNSRMHSCQITGIKLLGNTLLTTSIDQRLTVWKCSIENNHISMKFINQYISPIADIQGMEAFQKADNLAYVFLYGKGMEVIQVQTLME